MSSTGLDSFERAQQRTNAWLATVAAEFDTDDRKFALRALRAWLHAVRDRLTVPAAAKFAAQLPELLRGMYYDGWSPTGVPVKFGPDDFIQRFAAEARIRAAEVPEAAGAVARALGRHLSEGQLAETLSELPRDLRELFTGASGGHARRPEPAGDGHRSGGRASDDRLYRLEQRLDTLTDAVEVLARGLEDGAPTAHDGDHRARSARLAAEILLAARA